MGSVKACENVGYSYYNDRQFAKAKAMFEKGCNANLADSCSNLGILYEFGEGVRQDLSTAKFYYGKDCDGYKRLNQRRVK